MRGPAVWAFGGGKGGVGKSLVCANVGGELARRGYKTLLLDADLGAANLHTLLGIIRPEHTLDEFLAAEIDEQQLRLSTSTPGLELISGAAAILRAAHPRPMERLYLIRSLLAMELDFILIDLGAGTHYNILDLFNLAGLGLLVTGPEPTSIQNAYAFLKAAIFRLLERGLPPLPWVRRALDRAARPRAEARIDAIEGLFELFMEREPQLALQAKGLLERFKARLIINMASQREEQRVQGALSVVCRRYLSYELPHLITLPLEAELPKAVRRMKPAILKDRVFGQRIARLVDRLLEDPGELRLEMLESPSVDFEPSPLSRAPELEKAPELELLGTEPSKSPESELLESEPPEEPDPPKEPEPELLEPDPPPIPEPPKDPWADFDPWGSLVLSSKTVVQPSTPSVTPRGLEDPPPHEILRLEEEVSCAEERYWLQTADLAPESAIIRLRVSQGRQLLGEQERDYSDLLQAKEFRQIPLKLRALHSAQKQDLSRGLRFWEELRRGS